MPYCSICMAIGWNGLSMPTDGCSVHMHIIITNSKLRGVEQDSAPYMMKVILPTFLLSVGLLTYMYICHSVCLELPFPSLK